MSWVKAEPLNQSAGIRFRFPAVQFSKFSLQFRCPDTVFIAEILFRIQSIFFFHDLIEARIAHDNRIQHGVLFKGEVILLQHGHAHVGRIAYRTRGRLQVSGKHPEKCCLAGAVCPDDTVAVTGCKFEIDVFEQRLTAEIYADI